jgi:hypothetical protein
MRDKMRTFLLNRKEDVSGISGTGIVAEGVQFSNGKCVVVWLTEYASVAIYDTMNDLQEVHCHEGKTLIEWIEG